MDNINNYILLSKKVIDDFININDENIYKNLQCKILPILKKLIEVLFINNTDIALQYKIDIIEVILNKYNDNSENYIVNLQSIIKKIKRKNFMINVN